MRTTFNPSPNPRPHANPNPNPNQVDPDPNPHPNTNPHPNQVDARYAPVYLGGWQSSRASDLAVNNNFATYSARATADKLTIDHDHNTKMFRGYMCPSCNKSLSWLGDTYEGAVAKKADQMFIDYLKRAEWRMGKTFHALGKYSGR